MMLYYSLRAKTNKIVISDKYSGSVLYQFGTICIHFNRSIIFFPFKVFLFLYPFISSCYSSHFVSAHSSLTNHSQSYPWKHHRLPSTHSYSCCDYFFARMTYLIPPMACLYFSRQYFDWLSQCFLFCPRMFGSRMGFPIWVCSYWIGMWFVWVCWFFWLLLLSYLMVL